MNTYQKIKQQKQFSNPSGYPTIKTIDLHTCGEPLRVILEGFPEPRRDSVLSYRQQLREHHDHLRTALMFEPRGHADMYGCVMCPPNDPDGDFGIVFLHNEGYSTMCGHAIIGIATLAVEMNWIEIKEGENELKIDAPCGRIHAFVRVKKDKVSGVRFHCVPSFVAGLDKTVDVRGLGKVTYDLAYGGAFYAYVDMHKNQFDFDLRPHSFRQLIQAGMAIKHAVMQIDPDILHPFEPELSFLYGTIFIGDPIHTGADSRNVCVFAEGEVDRCPTGSGVSGRMAIHHARNELVLKEKMRIESIIDTQFVGSIVKEVEYGPHQAIIPQVEGTAHVTGAHTFYLDPADPLKEGFILR